MSKSEVQIAALAALFVFTCVGWAGNPSDFSCHSIKPDLRDGWTRLPGPPVDFAHILASVDKPSDPQEDAFVRETVWYKRGDDKYLAYQPGVDRHNCWEMVYVFTRVGDHWTEKWDTSCECTS